MNGLSEQREARGGAWSPATGFATTAARRPRAPRCERCAWYRSRTAVVCARADLGITLDVAKAERIVRARPRELTRYTPRQMRFYVTASDVVLSHVPHVDSLKPGIFGVVRHKGRRRRVLIEGSHRAYSSRLSRADYFAYELTEAETAECLL